MVASRQTLLSLLYRVGTIGFTFVSVSYLVKNLGPEKYGAWATLVSALAWIQMSDFGIGYAIKNQVASRQDEQLLCDQIAMAVYLSTFIALGLVLAYAIAWPHVAIARDYPLEASLLYVSAFLTLPAMIGANILQGLNLSATTFQAAMVQSMAWLALVILLGYRTSTLSLAIGFSTLWIANSAYQFCRAYGALGLGRLNFPRRVFVYHSFKKLRLLLHVGGSFFLLQLTGLVVFNLGTFLVYTSYSATAAATYDILNKIYLVPMTLFNVVITIAWSHISIEMSRRNTLQLVRIHRQLVALALAGGALIIACSLVLVPHFVVLYSHGQLSVTRGEVLWFAAQICVQITAYAGAVFMNAAERLRIQIIFAVISMTLFLPLFYLMYSFGLTLVSIPIATMLVVLPGAVYFNYYARRHIIGALPA